MYIEIQKNGEYKDKIKGIYIINAVGKKKNHEMKL